MTTRTAATESLTIDQLDALLSRKCQHCRNGWTPCTDHQPHAEIDAEGTYTWCDNCEGTGRETCLECW